MRGNLIAFSDRAGHQRSLLWGLRGQGSVSFYSTDHPDYVKRNYAKNVSEYNTVVGSLAAQRRYRTCCLPLSPLLSSGLWLRMLVVIGAMVKLGVGSDKGLILFGVLSLDPTRDSTP